MALGKVIGLGPGHIVLDDRPTLAPPHFRPMPIVAKRSPISATAELLYMYIPLFLQIVSLHILRLTNETNIPFDLIKKHFHLC